MSALFGSGRFKISVLTFVAISIAVIGQTPAFAEEQPSGFFQCLKGRFETGLKKVKKKLEPPSQEEMDRLYKVQVSDLFPESETIEIGREGHTLERAKDFGTQMKEFKKQWDELLYHRVGIAEFPARTLKQAIQEAKTGSTYPNLTAIEIESYRKSGVTIGELQDFFLHEYNAKKYAKNGDLEGWKKYLSLQSPYNLARWVANTGRDLLGGVPGAIRGVFIVALASPLTLPVIDFYKKGVSILTSTAMDQLSRQHRLLIEAIEQNNKLENDVQAVDFEKLPSKQERLRKWAELEASFQASHKKIRELRSKLKTPEAETGKPEAATRQIFLLSLPQLAKDKTLVAAMAKATALGRLKGQELLAPSPSSKDDPETELFNTVLDQLAENPKAFDAFVKEFLRTQSLNSDATPAKP